MKRVAFVLLCTTLALAGCGDDEGDDGGGSDSGDEVVAAPEPATPLEEHLEVINQAIADEDCETIVEETFSVQRQGEGGAPADPGAPATEQECSPKAFAQMLLRDAAGTEFTESEESGPAAISDGAAGKPFQGYDNWSMVSLVDRDGDWADLLVIPADPQVGEDPPADADNAENVDLFLEAVRSGDCAEADKIFFPESPLAQGKGAQGACETITSGQIFAPALKATPDAEAEELIVARDVALYGVPTKEAYFAVVMLTPPTPAGSPPQSHFTVSDVVPLTDVEFEPPPAEESGGEPQTETGGT